jgi:tripartite-type tricarboxylate transporter receptor subunit TctC
LPAPLRRLRLVIASFNREVNAGLADPTTRAKLTGLGDMVLPGTPADFDKFVVDETDKWAKVIKQANIKLG